MQLDEISAWNRVQNAIDQNAVVAWLAFADDSDNAGFAMQWTRVTGIFGVMDANVLAKVGVSDHAAASWPMDGAGSSTPKMSGRKT